MIAILAIIYKTITLNFEFKIFHENGESLRAQKHGRLVGLNLKFFVGVKNPKNHQIEVFERKNESNVKNARVGYYSDHN